MSIFKKLFLFLILASVSVASASASYKLVLQSGHDGLPIEMKWHEKSRTIVSAGEDGRLIVTRPGDNKVLHRFRVTGDRIYGLELDTANNKAAVITLKEGYYTVSVWDWNKEELIFDYELESEPLFTSWSAKGRYLTIGNLGNPSILVLEGRTGRRLSYLQRLPSLYNAGYIGSTESILMTYSVNGALRYWDIRSSALKLSTQTLPNLQNITVLQTDSKTTLFASKDNTLYLINRQTGAVLDQLVIPGIRDVSIDEKNGELDALTITLSGASLHRYKVRNERFIPGDFGEENLSSIAVPVPIDSGINPLKVLRTNGNSYLLSRNGNLYIDNSIGFVQVINDRLWKPDSLAFNENSFYLSNSNKIIQATSAFFSSTSRGNIRDLQDVKLDEMYTNSQASETGIKVLPGNIILQWDRSTDGDGNGIRRLRFKSINEEILFQGSGSIEKIDILDDERILTVNRSGTVEILNSLTGEVESSYSALGILDSAYSSDGNYLLAGRSSRGRAGTPLEMIDIETKEAIPLPDPRFMIYSIIDGPSSLYSIGISTDSHGKSETSILRHDKSNPENTRTMLNVTGEYLDGYALPDPDDNNTIYTSLGGIVHKINGRRKTEFEWNENIYRLALNADVLYGLDKDGALVLWNVNTGRSLIKIFFFNDGGWIAIPPDGTKIWASSGAIDNVIIYRDGRVIDPSRVSQILENSEPHI